MDLVNQHTKRIMEGCKERARDAGLRFEDETLEYIVTNRDLLELSPKMMIPTLYDYWVHDVEVLKEKGKYELYPSNPYETVINTRPAISFYNDNNPDWMNVMIFYHVLAHIDFFQNNLYFRHTWDYDFTGQALSDKRMIAGLRAEKGRWVDYFIEFARGIDNLVGYFTELSTLHRRPPPNQSPRLNYYFDVFLQEIKKAKANDYLKEIQRYNDCIRDSEDQGERAFFSETARKFPEFEALFQKSLEAKAKPALDLLQFLWEHSEALNKDENLWMKSVLQMVRSNSLFFQPQIRTKIMNEGWASYWHETLFLLDDRIHGHEVDCARVNSGVTVMPRGGLNPYALGMRLFQYIEEMADKGRFSFEYRSLLDVDQRNRYDTGAGGGKQAIFGIRENFGDFTFIQTFLDQDFVDRNNLFVAGRRMNQDRMVWEYYVRSRKATDYRNMVIDSLYHPPRIDISTENDGSKTLYLNHRFEGKPLVRDFIQNTMIGIEFLWGKPVKLETSERKASAPSTEASTPGAPPGSDTDAAWERVVYTVTDKKLTQEVIAG